MKRPPSSYMIFATEKRKEIQTNNPTMNLLEVVKQCAQDWNQLSEYDREVFYNKAKQEKEEYEKLMKNYVFIMRGLDEF